MFTVNMPLVQVGVQSLKWNDPILGHVTNYMYVPIHSTLAEVDDLWYERRVGPTEEEVMHHKVYGTPLTTPKGKFSAVCHVKPVQDVFTWPACRPEDRIDPYRFLSCRGWNTMYWEYADSLICTDKTNGVYRGALWYPITGPDGTPGVRYGYLYLRTKFSECSIQLHDFYNVRKSGGSTQPRRYAWRRVDYKNYSVADETTLDPSYWNGSTMRDCMEMRATLGNVTTSDITELQAHVFNSPEVDIDYVKSYCTKALHSALRYEDQQLVDWSVDDYQGTPWALQNIDIITGQARAFIDATVDIPLANENMLQCIAEGLTALMCFALKPEATQDMFESIVKSRSPVDWYRTTRFGFSDQTREERLIQSYRDTNFARWDPNWIIRDVDGWRERFGNWWLKGRYVFSTTIMDAESTWTYFYDQAQRWIGARSDDYKCHGKDDTGDLIVQCTYIARERALSGIVKAFEACYRQGLEPNAYVLWDFVPYSFVVDWFLPVGNSLNAYTRASHFCPEYWEFQPRYDGKSFCYSVSYTSDTDIGACEVYTRWYERDRPEVEPAYFLKPDAPAQNTVCKRVVDGIALFHL